MVRNPRPFPPRSISSIDKNFTRIFNSTSVSCVFDVGSYRRKPLNPLMDCMTLDISGAFLGLVGWKTVAIRKKMIIVSIRWIYSFDRIYELTLHLSVVTRSGSHLQAGIARLGHVGGAILKGSDPRGRWNYRRLGRSKACLFADDVARRLDGRVHVGQLGLPDRSRLFHLGLLDVGRQAEQFGLPFLGAALRRELRIC